MLTGRTRYRIGFRKKLVLQVQCWYRPFARYPSTVVSAYAGWRDATVEDMQAIERGEIQPDKPEPAARWSAPPRPDGWRVPACVSQPDSQSPPVRNPTSQRVD